LLLVATRAAAPRPRRNSVERPFKIFRRIARVDLARRLAEALRSFLVGDGLFFRGHQITIPRLFFLDKRQAKLARIAALPFLPCFSFTLK
jgi:hypothetical protein